MIISNEIKTRKIELTKIEAIQQYLPSYQFEIKLETENIRAKIVNFTWISEEEIDNFLVELDRLDRERKGLAELNSLSPGEFSLIFKAIDKLGHIAVSLNFSEQDKTANDYSYNLGIEFQTDPTILQQVIADIKRLKE